MSFSIGVWDIALVAVVSAMATVLAYLHHPKLKAFMVTLPIPFTIASLAVGRPIDASNVLGLLALLAFTHGVRVLHQNLRMPIIPSIVLSASGYCLIGAALARVVRGDSQVVFWFACPLVFAVGAVLHIFTQDREEPGYRTPLPVWLKLPGVVTVVLFLVLIKRTLMGFTTVFPMVGVFAAYEARFSLWTICRQIPVVMLAYIPMMVVCRLTQYKLGLGVALMLGWVVLLAVLLLLNRNLISLKKEKQGE